MTRVLIIAIALAWVASSSAETLHKCTPDQKASDCVVEYLKNDENTRKTVVEQINKRIKQGGGSGFPENSQLGRVDVMNIQAFGDGHWLGETYLAAVRIAGTFAAQAFFTVTVNHHFYEEEEPGRKNEVSIDALKQVSLSAASK